MGIGNELRNVLKERNMTIKELSAKADVPYNTLYACINRDSNSIKSDYLVKIIRTLYPNEEEAPIFNVYEKIPESIDYIRQNTSVQLSGPNRLRLKEETERFNNIKPKTNLGDIVNFFCGAPAMSNLGYFSADEEILLNMYRKCDEKGKYTINALIRIEYERSMKESLISDHKKTSKK